MHVKLPAHSLQLLLSIIVSINDQHEFKLVHTELQQLIADLEWEPVHLQILKLIRQVIKEQL